MDTTIAGLVGALIGATAGIGGTFTAHLLQARTARKIWLRDQKQLAYASAIRYMLRAINKKGKFAVSMPFNMLIIKLGPDTWDAFLEAASELVDDLSEVQVALTNLTIYASATQKAKIKRVLNDLNISISRFLGDVQAVKMVAFGKRSNSKGSSQIEAIRYEDVQSKVKKALDVVVECARQEIGLEIG